MSHYEPLKDHQ